jgi:quinol monooxygenase YgiN
MTNNDTACMTVLWEARAKAGKQDQMRAFLSAAVTASRHDTGNIDYEAHEVQGQPGTFIIYERWVSREALDAHLGAPRMDELVPELEDLLEGSIQDGIRILQAFRPAV